MLSTLIDPWLLYPLITALKKLSVENLSNLTPHPWKVFLAYSHPPVLERIRSIRQTAENL